MTFRRVTKPWRGEDGALWETCLQTGRVRRAKLQYPLATQQPVKVETAIEREQREAVERRGKQLAEETDEWLKWRR